MKRKILGALAALVLFLLSLSACASAITTADLAAGYERAAWQMACEAKKFDCSKIRMAIVAYAPMEPGLLGFYPHQSQIALVTMKFYGKPESAVVATHELIHLIQSFDGSNMTSCQREQEAFDLTYLMNKKYKLVDDTSPLEVVMWSEMSAQYGCSLAP